MGLLAHRAWAILPSQSSLLSPLTHVLRELVVIGSGVAIFMHVTAFVGKESVTHFCP